MKNLIADSMMLAQIELGNKAKLGEFSNARDITIENMISAFLKGILVVAGVVFFFILVVGGIKWILSGGDKAHTEGARNQITSALIGLVIVFSAWAIAGLLNTFFGVDILELKIPSAQTGL